MLAAPAAFAADPAPCGSGLVCASNPRSVADAVIAAGYKAQLTKDDIGDPRIESAASGYKFNIFFYDCEENKACAALQFNISFADDGKNTLAMVNDWNRKKRFMQMSVLPDKSLRVSYDVTTKGGMTAANFADVVDWWSVMLGELGVYFKEQGG
jgi:hypothetical protein